MRESVEFSEGAGDHRAPVSTGADRGPSSVGRALRQRGPSGHWTRGSG